MDHPKSIYNEMRMKNPKLPEVKIVYGMDSDKDTLGFRGECEIALNGEKVFFSSKNHRNKKSAEKEVYQYILEYLREHPDSGNVPILKIKEKTLFLVDLENVNSKEERELLGQIRSLDKKQKIESLTFVNRLHPLKESADIVVESNHKDAVDHYITFYLGTIYHKYKDHTIYVVSRDHFASCLQDFCKNVKHIASLKDVIG